MCNILGDRHIWLKVTRRVARPYIGNRAIDVLARGATTSKDLCVCLAAAISLEEVIWVHKKQD